MVDLVIPVVIVLGSVALVALLINRREGSYKDIFEHLPDPVMRVSIDSFEPVLCNVALSNLLGYSSPKACCRGFNQNPHLPDESFYQIWQENKGRTPKKLMIQLHDRSGQIVATSINVRIDRRNHFMDLHVLPLTTVDIAEQMLSQNVVCYLELDDRLTIRRCNRLAHDTFGEINLGTQTLPELAFPDELASRLLRIYRSRLTRHGQLTLRHPNKLDSGEVMGGWWITRSSSPDTYHAMFQDQSASGLPLSSPLYELLDEGVGFWEMDLQKGVIQHNRTWLERLHYKELPAINPLQSWISLVVPEDRETVSKAFDCQEEHFGVSYRMASGRGVLLNMETRGYVKERDYQGKPRALQGIHINRTYDFRTGGTQSESSVRTLAGNLGYHLKDTNGRVNNSQFEGILSTIGDYLITEFGRDVVKYLDMPDNETMRCSSCVDDRGIAKTFTVSCPDASISRQMLPHLLTAGFSTSRIHPVDSINLARINRRIHDAGGHLELSTGQSGGLEIGVNLPAETGPRTSDILIIDDEISVAHFIREVVMQAGYSATVMTSPERAMQMFRADPNQFGLVITDQVMPSFTGDALIRLMLEISPDLPIILCSGYSDKIGPTGALAIGARAFLKKPIDATQLLGLVADALELPRGREVV